MFDSLVDACRFSRIVKSEIWVASRYEKGVLYKVFPGGRTIRYESKNAGTDTATQQDKDLKQL